MDALTRMENPKQVARRRGLPVHRILGMEKKQQDKQDG